MSTTPHLGLTELQSQQSSIDVTVNEMLRLAEGAIQGNVKDKDTVTPPGVPSDGDRYIVGPSATGDWSGEDDNIAVYKSSSWTFLTPSEGWVVYIQDEDLFYIYRGTSAGWEEFQGHEFSTPHDIYAFFSGVPSGSQKCYYVPVARDIYFPSTWDGSHADAGTAPGSSVAFTILVGGSSEGTVTFATATAGSFSGGDFTALAGEILEIRAPASPDGIADIGFVLKGTLV